ncbi:MAG: type II toxin-antitoxin system RelE/ParE family toxin [Oscillospiraceae bacterium]|nr:type II toxin-antitoxin system RelE/ParE family toxin [Oscillospiraceae bacterium]
MKIKYSKQSLKFLAKQEKASANRIISAVNKLTQGASIGDIKPLQGSKNGNMRLRIGSYRVIYRYDMDNEVRILYVDKIDNRGDVYK